MADLTPDVLDLRWGDHTSERLDILRHPIRRSGGNPAIVFRHGGGAEAGDKRQPWLNNAPGNPLASWIYALAGPTVVPFDFISVETPQASFNSPTVVPHLPSTFDEPRSVPGFFPSSFQAGQRVMAWLATHAEELDLSGDNACYGISYGAHLWLATQAWSPLVVTRTGIQQNARYEGRRRDSRAFALVNEAGQIDYRNLAGVDQILWTWGDAHFGAWTQAEWDAIPAGMKEAVSIMAAFDRGETRWIPPVFSIYEPRGDHVHPYANPHDDAQLTTLHDALDQAGVADCVRRPIAIDEWTDPTNGPLLAEAVYSWLVARLPQS